ncbi:hypothetical protein HF521_002895 [Silurus meridionalis]|uniref:Uncharacterized protein n=1 Tax=Silurus meridionalis TaxID=175797 RepID=A0A8T0B1A3_SILME|nr:hypothetical protein HF521_002895 [Silurus meridionalis]
MMSGDKGVMEAVAVRIKNALLRLHSKGVDLEWNNDKLLLWYSTVGKKLESKKMSLRKRDQLKQLRAQVEASAYDKQTWARQGAVMETKIKRLENKLQLDKEYTTVLEGCCNSAGLPIPALRSAAINSKLESEIHSDSDENDVIACSSRALKISQTVRSSSPEPVNNQYNHHLNNTELRRRSPVMTRTRSGSVRKTLKSV